MATDQIVLLKIEEVDPPGDAVRETIDPEKVRELAESIRSQTLLQPILVRPLHGRFEVVIGHRRYLAHRLLGLVTIKGIVRELSDEETLVIRLIENDQREDLNPIERAKQYRKLRDKLGYTIERIAEAMGKNKMTIWKYLQILEIPEEFHKFLANETLPMSVALVLNEIEDVDFKRYYIGLAVENGTTCEVAKLWVEDHRKTREGSYYTGGGGGGGPLDIPAPIPIFQTCVCCLGPIEGSKVKYIPVCPTCEPQIKAALANKERN